MKRFMLTLWDLLQISETPKPRSDRSRPGPEPPRPAGAAASRECRADTINSSMR